MASTVRCGMVAKLAASFADIETVPWSGLLDFGDLESVLSY